MCRLCRVKGPPCENDAARRRCLEATVDCLLRCGDRKVASPSLHKTVPARRSDAFSVIVPLTLLPSELTFCCGNCSSAHAHGVGAKDFLSGKLLRSHSSAAWSPAEEIAS